MGKAGTWQCSAFLLSDVTLTRASFTFETHTDGTAFHFNMMNYLNAHIGLLLKGVPMDHGAVHTQLINKHCQGGNASFIESKTIE